MRLKVCGAGLWLMCLVMLRADSSRADASREVLEARVRQASGRAAPPPVFIRVCTRCHAQDRVLEGRRSSEQWEEVLGKMAEKIAAEGGKLLDEDYAAIEDFLLREYGRVNVNRDPADLLSLVLGIAPKDAEAIVSYRASHGRFEDFAALQAMPGAPVEALTQRRDALVF